MKQPDKIIQATIFSTCYVVVDGETHHHANLANKGRPYDYLASCLEIVSARYPGQVIKINCATRTLELPFVVIIAPDEITVDYTPGHQLENKVTLKRDEDHLFKTTRIPQLYDALQSAWKTSLKKD